MLSLTVYQLHEENAAAQSLGAELAKLREQHQAKTKQCMNMQQECRDLKAALEDLQGQERERVQTVSGARPTSRAHIIDTLCHSP